MCEDDVTHWNLVHYSLLISAQCVGTPKWWSSYAKMESKYDLWPQLNVLQLNPNLDLNFINIIKFYFTSIYKKGLSSAFSIQNTHKHANWNSTQKRNIQLEYTSPAHNYCQCWLQSYSDDMTVSRCCYKTDGTDSRCAGSLKRSPNLL
jgi:hypothetical protein